MTAVQPDSLTVLDAIIATLTRAGEYNRHDQAAPAAVLWTDKERQWEVLLPLLRARLPLLTLGPYSPEECSGPSYWLRCALAGTVQVEWPAGVADDAVPIVYLPGVSRSDLRVVEDLPRPLQSLAELQFRGVLWVRRGSDWTPNAFLVSNDGGLGIEVASDEATRDALRLALPTLSGVQVARLEREAPLNAGFFYRLLAPDPIRDILNWLDDPAGAQAARDAGAWNAFAGLVRRSYGIDPERDGPVSAARRLGSREGAWDDVWTRYAEAPDRWPNVANQLRAAGPVQRGLFEQQLAEVWPQDNEHAETTLRGELRALSDATPQAAREVVRRLEAAHGPRRDWVWARLGQSTLALALEHLARLADAVERVPSGATVSAVTTAWTEWGWRAEDAALCALALAERTDDNVVVAAAVVALYGGWLEETARSFQEAVRAHPESWTRGAPVTESPGGVLLFSDALRYDAARRLATLLESRGYLVTLTWQLTALPGVTPTAKPAISPVAGRLAPSSGFDTTARDSGTRLTASGLRSLLAESGYQVLSGAEVGDPTGRGWAELGRIDSYGHEHGHRVARHLEGELHDLAERSVALLDAGWRDVTIITDHGWLLLPGGLPKDELPQHVTEPRKGRSARLTTLASVDQQTVPWHWDDSVRVAVPPGIAAYESGKEYEHGGLSPQECVVPILRVTRAAGPAAPVTIEEARWTRLRCRVTGVGAMSGASVDIRTQPGNALTSLSDAPASVIDGVASLIVEDADLEGSAAFIVVLDRDGTVVAQVLTTVGG